MKTPPVPPQAATQPAPRLVASTAGGLFILLVLLGGCAAMQQTAGEDLAGFKQTVDDMAATVALISTSQTTDTGGGDIYDPVAVWIAASSAPLLPICFLIYVIAKRTGLYRRLAGIAPARDQEG